MSHLYYPSEQKLAELKQDKIIGDISAGAYIRACFKRCDAMIANNSSWNQYLSKITLDKTEKRSFMFSITDLFTVNFAFM